MRLTNAINVNIQKVQVQRVNNKHTELGLFIYYLS